ncbi:MAG: ribonuclease H-like domain-containing protein [Butyrivibrio sp.]|nr:ribonuclease H-like domain-containing protein [Butyrivibrio sp.]
MIKTNEGFTANDNLDEVAIDLLQKKLGCKKEEILFIDIETTGLSPRNSELYLIGTGHFKDGKWLISQFFAENTSQEEQALSAFSDFSRSFKKLVHFNGDRFDIPFLKAKYEEHMLSDPFENMESFDLYKHVKPYKTQLGLADGKQKTVETFLGIDREDKYDGGKLIAVYKDYEESGSDELLQLLLLHNFEDVKGMLKLLPILRYEKFFDMFRNMPKVSVRTDEEIDESLYLDDDNAETTAENKLRLQLPMRAVKVQANRYKDYDGEEKSEVYMKLMLNIELPSQIAGIYGGCYFKAKGTEATLKVPLYETELKYFYSNYKDYYYLPGEDMAIHKTLATYVDKNFREKAKPENCYTKKQGQYLMEWDLVFTPFFKRDYSDKSFFFDLNDNMKQSRFAMSLYGCHVVAHVLDL